MASTYTPILRLELMGTGDQNDTWGTTLDNQMGLLENAIAKRQALATTGGTTTLNTVNGADDQSRSLCLDLSGNLASNAIIVVPSLSKMYLVRNGTTGAFTVTVKTGAGTGIVIPQDGTVIALYCDGTNVNSIAITGTLNADTLDGIDSTGFFILANTNVVQKGYSETPKLLTDGATITMDVAAAVVNKVILAGTPRTLVVTNAVAGAKFELYIKQDASGGRTLVLPGNFLFNNSTTPTLSTAANAVDKLYGRYDATDGVWRCDFQGNYTTGTVVATTGINITSNETDVDIYARAGSPAGAVTVAVTIATGVIVSASSTATPAMSLAGFAAGSIISITNLGYILGKGGHGGSGASLSGTAAQGIGDSSIGFNGYNGGPAMKMPAAGTVVTIFNGSGFIWGGGGGGGGGGVTPSGGVDQTAGGGGGGGGNGGGLGASGGGGIQGGAAASARGGSGTDGGTGPTGAAGTGGTGVKNGGTTSVGNGGVGGDFGANGSVGTDTDHGGAGTAGKAIDLNGNATTTLSTGAGAPHVKGVVS
jgi:hypothetical protein